MIPKSSSMPEALDPLLDFIAAACVPLDGRHTCGIRSRDGNGRIPLALAVRACVDSHWTDRRSPESVRALLQVGASVSSVRCPSGYAEVDALLKTHGAVA
jgi:hypothetical protein